MWVVIVFGVLSGIVRATDKRSAEKARIRAAVQAELKRDVKKKTRPKSSSVPRYRPNTDDDLKDMKDFFSDKGSKPSDYK